MPLTDYQAVVARLLSGNRAVHVDLNQPGYIRAVVSKGEDATKVEWARDSCALPRTYSAV